MRPQDDLCKLRRGFGFIGRDDDQRGSVAENRAPLSIVAKLEKWRAPAFFFGKAGLERLERRVLRLTDDPPVAAS